MQNKVPISRSVILVGGGHTHTLFLQKWAMNSIPGVEVLLISPSSETAYTGMLPGMIAGHYKRDDINIDLVRLCRFAGARFVLGSVDSIDSNKNLVHLKDRKEIRYDVASIDIGATSLLPKPLDTNQFVQTVRPLSDFVVRWDAFIRRVKEKLVSPTVTIIGGGVGAVEIAMATAHAFQGIKCTDYNITLLDKDKILRGIKPRSRELIMKNLRSYSIEILENTMVKDVSESEVFSNKKRSIKSNFTILAVGASPYEWLSRTDLPLTEGFIDVDNKLLVRFCKNLFAVGDCANLSYDPRPKAGVFAVRQAPILFKNISSTLLHKNLKNYSPQRYNLKLISLGRKSALLDYILPTVWGKSIWYLKDKIDRSFMKKFSELQFKGISQEIMRPAKQVSENTGHYNLLCGGCGAKVPEDTLESILSKHKQQRSKKNIVAGIGDDGAIIRVGNANQLLTIDHLREFNSDLWRYSKIAAIHALGDIWSMGGSPQTVMMNLIIPEGSSNIQKGWLNQLIGGAVSIFDRERVAIIGGHTSIGAEFNIGFSLTGKIYKKQLLISGARPNDRLILTKPIGSGVILAGEMQLLSRGRWLEKALNWMEKSQKEASEILSVANAMTDITGFGLAGHLMRICEKSHVGAIINLSNVPLLEGAEELSELGIKSSIFFDNMNFRREKIKFCPSPKSNLLFDPQTAGGILASIPEELVDKTISALIQRGYCSNIIGRIIECEPQIKVE